MANPGFIKAFKVSGELQPFRIVTYTGTDFEVAQAVNSSTPIAGVTEWGKNVSNRADVVMSRMANVEYGDDVVAGDTLVPDTEGRAVKLDMDLKAEDAEVWVIGVAQESGKLGTIGTTTVAPFLIVK